VPGVVLRDKAIVVYLIENKRVTVNDPLRRPAFVLRFAWLELNGFRLATEKIIKCHISLISVEPRAAKAPVLA
jgi:hypothetical protein